MELTTPRLRLRLLEPLELEALLEGRPLPGRRWAEGYPMEGTLVSAAIQLDLRRQDRDPGPFGHFQLSLPADDDIAIGDVAFHAPPDDLGELSIGFGIVPVARRRGFAVEALRAALAWALAHPEVRSVHADTDLVNLASQRVLVRAGMHLAADEGDRKVFEVHAG